jgi:hypothetical protein
VQKGKKIQNFKNGILKVFLVAAGSFTKQSAHSG